MDHWVLGFLWGCGRVSGEYFLVQSKYAVYVKRVRDTIAPEKQLTPLERGTGESWKVKIRLDNPYIKWLFDNGYEGRIGNVQREIPEFDSVEKEADFLRGYFSIHYTHDSIKIKGKAVPRLRFYAAEKILERLNQHLHMQLGTTLKKVQKHGQSNVCHVLYYFSKREIPKILEYLQLALPDGQIPQERKIVVCSATGCENTFLQKSHRHRFCSRRCQQRMQKRLEYVKKRAKLEKPP